MEWLTNLLGFANNGTSPFGSLSGSTAMTPPQGGAAPQMDPLSQTPAAPSAAPAAASGMQMPGLLGKLLGQQQGPTGTGTQPGLLGQGSGGANGALLNQAMQLMKPPQMQVPQMNLLSGPRG